MTKIPTIHQQFGHIFGGKKDDTEGLTKFRRNVIGNSYIESEENKEG